jgi:HPt (histidine-containing phosphotransfer) domain-containing protein
MDVRMPELDGLEATRAIRTGDGPCKDRPIIAFTANAFRDDISECLEAGMTDFVAKPMKKRLLLEALARQLCSGSAERANLNSSDIICDNNMVPCLDRAVVEELRGELGHDAFAESVSCFLEETATRIAVLRDLYARNEVDTLRRDVHSIKGTSGTFGAELLRNAAALLEASLRAGSPASNPDHLIGDVEDTFSKTRSALAAQLVA